jgi:surface antigen
MKVFRQFGWSIATQAGVEGRIDGPSRRGRVALALGLFALAAVGAVSAPAAGQQSPKPLPVRLNPVPIRDGKGLDVRLRSLSAARCDLRVAAKRSVQDLPAVKTDGKGRARWRWNLPDTAPSGKWVFKAHCKRGKRIGRAQESLIVLTGNSQASGPLVSVPTLDVGGAGGFNCWTDGSSNHYCAQQCTWYVKNQYDEVPNGWGDAHNWDDQARAYGHGFDVSGTPRVGAIAVWEAWSGVPTGHVAIVKEIHDGYITVREYNWAVDYGYGEHNTAVGGAGHPSSFICPPNRCSNPVTFPFDDVHVYSSNTLTVAAGDVVNATVTAHYVGTQAVPCGNANLGVIGDAPAVYADYSAGFWPASPWRSSNRVAIDGCNGTLNPGNYATWKLRFKPPSDAPAGVRLTGNYAPIWEGVGWSDLSIPISLNVTRSGEQGTYPAPDPNAPAYAAQFVGQTFQPVLAPGATGDVQIKLKNVGKSQWDETVHLATPDDSAIRNAAGGVLNGNRVALTDVEGDGLVAPNEVATFTYQVKSANATAYRQHFDLVRDPSGPRFGDALGLYIPTVIADGSHFPPELTAGDCTWSFVSQSGSPLASGRVVATNAQDGTFQFTIKNTSDLCPWFASGANAFHLGTTQPTDRGSGFADTTGGWLSTNRIAIPQDTPPRGTVTIAFDLHPASWVPVGDYNEHFAPVIEGKFHLQDQGMFAPVHRG